MQTPAVRWQDALPCGNGTLGALVYGNVAHETIVLNHERLWYGSRTSSLPDISTHLPRLRRLLDEGRYQEANDLFPSLLKSAGYEAQIGMFQPGVDLCLRMPTHGAVRNYRRTLDLQTGEATVRWDDCGLSLCRRLFVSRCDDLVCLSIQGSERGAISAALSLNPRDPRDSGGPGIKPPPFTFDASANEDGFIRIIGRRKDGTEFGAVARVFTRGGRLTMKGAELCVSNADEIVVLAKVRTDWPSRPRLEDLCQEFQQYDPDYEMFFARHAPLQRQLFRRVTVELGPDVTTRSSNERLLLDAYGGEVPTELIERMFHFGRYLLICSSRPGGLPAHLQGVWSGDYDPAWACAYFNNENIQMNYWQALAGNLPETTLPLFDLYETLLPDFRQNARSLYGCRGIFVPLYLAPDSGLLKDPQPHVVYWSAGAGWIAQLFYDYWLFTRDREFLRNRALPFMKEVAQFYEDFLETSGDGSYRVSPSNSPENVPNGSFPGAGTLAVSINATMDFAIAREVLVNLCAGYDELQIDEPQRRRWRAMLAKIPPYEVNPDGAIREWMHPDLHDNYHHRHQSHLYALFPGTEITAETNPEIYQACRVAVEKRLGIGLSAQSGWSLAHMANIYARLGDGDRTLECLELLARSCLGGNLFTYHNDWRRQGITLDFDCNGRGAPFQIDANFGWSAAVLEMLVFSTSQTVSLLPALPRKWRKGKARGLRCRCGVEVSLKWDLDRGRFTAQLRSMLDQEVQIKLPAAAAEISTRKSDDSRWSPQPDDPHLTLRLTKDRPVRLKACLQDGELLHAQ